MHSDRMVKKAESYTIGQQNYIQLYQKLLRMENSKRRRGISLSHHTSQAPSEASQLDKSLYVDPQTTRMQYNRYQLQQTPSRHASAPKTKVQFNYPVQFAGTINSAPFTPTPTVQLPETKFTPRSPAYFRPVVELRPQPNLQNRFNLRPQLVNSSFKVEPKPQETPQAKFAPIPQMFDSTYHIEVNPPQQIKYTPSLPSFDYAKTDFAEAKQPSKAEIEVFPEKYQSFEQCKESIGKRLFGAGSIKRKENTLQETDRANRWLAQENSQNAFSQTSIAECVKEATKANPQPVEVHRKPQLQIQKEVLKYTPFAPCSKENTAPTPAPAPAKKQKLKTRDPQKLQEMEKRLMEIIKICDENLC